MMNTVPKVYNTPYGSYFDIPTSVFKDRANFYFFCCKGSC